MRAIVRGVAFIGIVFMALTMMSIFKGLMLLAMFVIWVLAG